MPNFYNNIIIEFDSETNQYSVANDSTPWIFWLWDSKELALFDYFSCLQSAYFNNLINSNEVKAVA